MKYLFESKVEKNDKGYLIQIPFNIWEVCRQREAIKADLRLNGKALDCELLPREKGLYEIFIDGEDAVDCDLHKTYEILLHVPASLNKLDQDSPYSSGNPIRKIDGVQIIIQPADGLCGQACVAMLAGVTIEDVNRVMNCREWQATMGHVISALNYYGFEHGGVIHYTRGKEVTLPKCCIMMEKMGRYCHYLVHYDGRYYDSNLGVMEDYDMSKLIGYLEVICR